MDNELDKLEVARDFYMDKTGTECPPVENGAFFEFVKQFVRRTADETHLIGLSPQAFCQVLRGNFGVELPCGSLLTVYKKRVARHDLTPSVRLAWYLAQKTDLIGWRANVYAEYQSPELTRASLERVLLFLGIGGERLRAEFVDEFRSHCLGSCPIKPFLPRSKKPQAATERYDFVHQLMVAVDQIQTNAGYTDAYSIGKRGRTLSWELLSVRPLLRETINQIDVSGYQLLCEVLAEKLRESQFWFAHPIGESGITNILSLVDSWTYSTEDVSE